MKINVEVIQRGTSPDRFLQNIEFKFITMKEGMKRLGEGTRDYMRGIITTNKKPNPQSKNILEKRNS